MTTTLSIMSAGGVQVEMGDDDPFTLPARVGQIFAAKSGDSIILTPDGEAVDGEMAMGLMTGAHPVGLTIGEEDEEFVPKNAVRCVGAPANAAVAIRALAPGATDLS